MECFENWSSFILKFRNKEAYLTISDKAKIRK